MVDDHSNGWNLINRKTEYETGWYTGGYDRVEQPDGTEKKYYWAELSDAVVIVAKKNESLVVINQYRPAIRKNCMELPAGLVEADESYEDAAKRELIEETGYEANKIECIEDFWCSTGVLKHRRAIVFAGNLEETERAPGSNEFITVSTIPIEDALSEARSEPANDATIEGILLAKSDGYL